MFTLAHELVHVWLNRDGLFNLIGMASFSNDVEKFCNSVAAELLVPEQVLRERWPSVKHLGNPFASISKRFKVSPIVAARQAQNIGLITKRQFLEFYEKDRLHWKKTREEQNSGGGNFYAVQDSRLSMRFSNAIVCAVREGRLLHRDAWNLTGLKGETFNRFADHVMTRIRK